MNEVDEKVSVTVPVAAIEERHHGGLAGFRRSVPGGHATYRNDGAVTRVGFADREAARWWVRVLRMKGLRDGDIVVEP